MLSQKKDFDSEILVDVIRFICVVPSFPDSRTYVFEGAVFAKRVKPISELVLKAI